MKEDYLWDKTGQNAEIERLENALKAFRYQETEPPALPAKIIRLEKKSRFSFFRLSLALTSFAALTLVCLGVWLQFSPAKIEVAKDSTETIAPRIDEKISDEIPIQEPNDFVADKAGVPKQFVKRNVVKIRTNVLAKIRRNDFVARNVKGEKPAVKLTKEEKYAYDQLMLALSITGSKLKLVSDKVDGVEEKNVVLESGR